MPTLVRATDEEKRARDVLAHSAWGERLTVEGFVAREARLRAHPWARANMTTWLWREDDGRVLSSCETFRMSSWLRGAPGDSFGVASVFTEPALRGQGYAAQMMRALVAALRREEPRAHASILFSDVGEALYERASYRAVPAYDRVWPQLPLPPGEGPAGREGAALLSESQIAEALAHLPSPSLPFLIWPEAGQLDWHLERERAYAELLGRPRPRAAGARVGNGCALWAADFKNARLAILLLHATTAEEALSLTRAARAVAREAGLGEVLLWETPQPFAWPEGPEGGVRQKRNGERPMLAPLAEEVRAEDGAYVPRALWC